MSIMRAQPIVIMAPKPTSAIAKIAGQPSRVAIEYQLMVNDPARTANAKNDSEKYARWLIFLLSFYARKQKADLR